MRVTHNDEESKKKVLITIDKSTIDQQFIGTGFRNPGYKREADKMWTAFSRKPRRWGKETRKQIKEQLQFICRDLRYVSELTAQAATLTKPQAQRLVIINKVYAQQDEMFRNHVHSVNDRIVSLSQPEIRPIVRGKAKNPVEFGPKFDVSIADGVVDVECFSFDNFNESTDFSEALDHYHDEHGFYPDEALADTLYRTRKNIAMCSKPRYSPERFTPWPQAPTCRFQETT